MTDAEVMRPCPFCGGPPVVFGTDKLDPTSYVFCHECGAQGPTFDPTFAKQSKAWTLAQCRVEAARLWNVSDQRNADLYSPTRATIDVATGERIHQAGG